MLLKFLVKKINELNYLLYYYYLFYVNSVLVEKVKEFSMKNHILTSFGKNKQLLYDLINVLGKEYYGLISFA